MHVYVDQLYFCKGMAPEML